MSTILQTSPSVAPGSRRVRLTAWHLGFLFLFSALIFAGYMSYMKIAGQALECNVNSSLFDCGVVENSRWAYIMGFPTAMWGFAWYTVIGLSLLAQRTIPFFRSYGVPITFGMGLFAFAYHSYLTYTALTVIGKLCIYCIGAHTSMTLFLIVATYRLIQYMRTPVADDAAAA